MKKLIIMIGCLLPFLSFAATAENTSAVESFQELCAKEKDPIKRQNYCHILDQHSQAAITISGFPRETVTV